MSPEATMWRWPTGRTPFFKAATLLWLAELAKGARFGKDDDELEADEAYKVGEPGSNSCPKDHEALPDAESCEKAAGDLGHKYDQEITYAAFPKGCFQSLKPNTMHKFFFNLHPEGAGDAGARPVCRKIDEAVQVAKEDLAFQKGDTVLVEGRRGLIYWDGRPKHQFVSMHWEDDGSDSGVIEATKVRATFSRSIYAHFQDTRLHAKQDILAKAAKENKPILVLIMNSVSCKVCPHLTHGINTGQRVSHLLDKFIVVYTDQALDTKASEWSTEEHSYFPRALFFGMDGVPLDVHGEDAARPYLFQEEAPLHHAMMTAFTKAGGAKMAEDWAEDVAKRFVTIDTKEAICEKAASEGKPIMALVMTTWCSACLILRASINEGKEVRQLLEKFLLVYIEDGIGAGWRIESHNYIPQAIFLRSDCSRMNPRVKPQYRHFFADDAILGAGMRQALRLEAKKPTAYVKASLFDEDIAEQLTEYTKKEEIMAEAAKEKKLIMIVVTQPWCTVCHRLIQSINDGATVRELLPRFVVRHVEGTVEPPLWVDAGENYLPQVHFYDHEGARVEVQGPQDKFKRFFESEAIVASGMRLALGEEDPEL
eukprot:TRINITY_DN16838_c0_g1_i1.p1 TRINITY_DN16838_c0_g1~~TRINITY_DN16838_c0_g1_i1.p1  ORF type:complete len:595 (+),score=132.00 TRINITY_DN16838_c0_g1_i1:113-1897(+)